jgi:GrpB-like predicted nucleotidyltransferase (UPF0157 family)
VGCARVHVQMSVESVYLVPYDPHWPAPFEQERYSLGVAIEPWVVEVEHIGSTAVPGLDAKPVIDIMAGLRSHWDAAPCIEDLAKIGYSYLADHVLPDRLLFLVKTAEASRSVLKYHLHVAEVAGVFWERHLLFRDYLRAHPETANEYARLKYELAERFPRDVDAYTLAKTAFISAVVELARA